MKSTSSYQFQGSYTAQSSIRRNIGPSANDHEFNSLGRLRLQRSHSIHVRWVASCHIYHLDAQNLRSLHHCYHIPGQLQFTSCSWCSKLCILFLFYNYWFTLTPITITFTWHIVAIWASTEVSHRSDSESSGNTNVLNFRLHSWLLNSKVDSKSHEVYFKYLQVDHDYVINEERHGGLGNDLDPMRMRKGWLTFTRLYSHLPY